MTPLQTNPLTLFLSFIQGVKFIPIINFDAKHVWVYVLSMYGCMY